MQVQDAQKALISDTAIHSNERLSPFTPIERGHLVSYSRKTRPRLTSQPSWVGASPPFRGKSVATLFIMAAIVQAARTVEVIPEFLYDAPEQMGDITGKGYKRKFSL